MRLDLYLFENNYVKSRQKAKSLICDGCVKIDSKIIQKPSYDVDVNADHTIEINDTCPYVSRGGLKLESIIKATQVSIQDKVCLDIGASTGGFTHCLLLNGAKKVYAIDSGTNQLDKMILNDERVTSIENYNARNLELSDIGEYADVITIDVSFISQNLIIPAASKLLKDDGIYLSLIKPQFETTKSSIGKGGIVKDKKARFHAVMSVINCAKSNNLSCFSFIKSPIQGGDGNIEYLAAFSRHATSLNEDLIKKIVLEWFGDKNMKPKRQEKILEIISTRNIETQEDLISALRSEGFNATQATASRDIRQLKLVKVLDNGVYKYVAPKSEVDNSGTYNHALFSSITEIKYALNNVVIKTNPGLAQAVAAGIDTLHDVDILGCVAGDDCIILVSKSEDASKNITNKILKLAGK